MSGDPIVRGIVDKLYGDENESVEVIDCPDCGEDLVTEAGKSCPNCGHVYWPEPTVTMELTEAELIQLEFFGHCVPVGVRDEESLAMFERIRKALLEIRDMQ